MNSLLLKNIKSSWHETTPVLEYVYGIIDSKISNVELNTRKLLNKIKSTNSQAVHVSDKLEDIPSVPDISIDKYTNEQLFTHFEELSRSIYLLKHLKLSLNADNAVSVIQLLNDDNYMNITDKQIEEILNDSQTA